MYVYNLEFPSWCTELAIGDYRFVRVPEYAEQLASLQHLASFQAEFRIAANTGEHAITAEVELPAQEQPAVLGWTQRGDTALSDVLLLLSLFTGRDVFLAPDDPATPLTTDPRLYQWGGVLRSSLPQHRPPIGQTGDLAYAGRLFTQSLDQIVRLIQGAKWQDRFKEGHFLIMAQQAFRRQMLEASFMQCWTIWEHLFETLSRTLFSKDAMYRVDPVEKVFFVMSEFSMPGDSDLRTEKRLRSMAHIKKKLVHLGTFPRLPDNAYNEAVLFIRLTEFVLAKTLGL